MEIYILIHYCLRSGIWFVSCLITCLLSSETDFFLLFVCSLEEEWGIKEEMKDKTFNEFLCVMQFYLNCVLSPDSISSFFFFRWLQGYLKRLRDFGVGIKNCSRKWELSNWLLEFCLFFNRRVLRLCAFYLRFRRWWDFWDLVNKLENHENSSIGAYIIPIKNII